MKKVKLKLGNIWDYNYSQLSSKSDKELRSEYSRLRSIAQKRIGRLSKSEWTWTKTYQRHKSGYLKLSELENRSDLVKELSELASYVYGAESSISGLSETRKKSINTLHKNGFDFVTEQNWREWINFIDEYIRKLGYKSPTPEELNQFLSDEDMKVSPKDARQKFQDFIAMKVYS